MKLFPKDFLFGAATFAYQIEGAAFTDGRGKTSWDLHNHDEQGNPTGDVGDVACDHYHRYLEDIELMKTLGLQTYRFSISWTRIYPNGFGEINPKGVAFYQDLITKLLEAGIEPAVTLPAIMLGHYLIILSGDWGIVNDLVSSEWIMTR